MAAERNGDYVDRRGTAIVGLEIVGSGSERLGTGDLPGDDEAGDEWDETFEGNYAGGDAGIGAHRSRIAGRRRHGRLLGQRNHPSAKRRLGRPKRDRLQSGEPGGWSRGILSFRSPLVVEQSTVYDGQDAIYTHRSHDSVVRDNRIEGTGWEFT